MTQQLEGINDGMAFRGGFYRSADMARSRVSYRRLVWVELMY